jgi:type IV secretory pathway VirB2 component (pilin)
MAGSEWQRWLTMFSTFTNAFYNMTYRRVQITKGAGDFSTTQRINGAIAFVAVQLFLAPMLNELFAGRGPSDDKNKIKWMFKTILGNSASMLPVAGPVLNAGLSKVFGEFATYRATPFNSIADSAIKVFTNAKKQAVEGGNKYGVAKAIAEFGAYIAPYPMQFVTTAENAYDKFILHKKLDWDDLLYKQRKDTKK